MHIHVHLYPAYVHIPIYMYMQIGFEWQGPTLYHIPWPSSCTAFSQHGHPLETAHFCLRSNAHLWLCLLQVDLGVSELSSAQLSSALGTGMGSY